MLFMDREQWLIVGYYVVFVLILLGVLAVAAYLHL